MVPIFSMPPITLIPRYALPMAMLWLLLLMAAQPALAGTVRSIDASAAAGGVTVRVDVDGGFRAASSFALAGPERIVVDIDGARAGARPAAGAGGVKGVRIAQFTPDAVRLVIDLDRPMALAEVAARGDTGVLTLVLKPAAAAEFARYVKAPRRTHAAAGAPQPSAPAAVPARPVAIATPAAAAVPARPEPVLTRPIISASAPAPVSRAAIAARGKRPLVVIDPGHGGHDTGALSVLDGRREKDVTLAIAKAIKRDLDASGRVRTVLTRSDDRFLVLAERREVARRLKAELFISIHADSAGSPDARGATVYTLSDVASDREAAKLAARENKSDIINGVDLSKEASDVSSILIDLAQRDAMNVSSSFAALLQREMAPYVRFKNEFHRFAGFVVLKAPDTPSVLIETGYLSNMEDSRFLFSDAGQQAIARGVKNAVEAHFARRYRTR